jgi:hypothetical protein
MSESKIPISFDTLLRIVVSAFRDHDMFGLVHTISELSKYFGYYVWARTEDIILAFYETSDKVESLYITIVLRTGIALKVRVDKEKDSNEIFTMKVWVVPVE